MQEKLIILDTNNKVSASKHKKREQRRDKYRERLQRECFSAKYKYEQKEQSLSVMKLSVDNLDKVTSKDNAFLR